MPMPPHRRGQRGIALTYFGIFLIAIALIVGLAVDLGRAYAVRLQLAIAVDAAALAAARAVPDGEDEARREAEKIFAVNFPDGDLGVASMSGPSVEFDTVQNGPDRGAHLVTVSATAPLPTTFMRVGGFESIDVGARGQSTRRLVDLAFVIDHSASLVEGGAYGAVKEAANQFIDFFDDANDRVSLILFGTDTVVTDPIHDNSRGFDSASIHNHINSSAAIGKTATAEGLYRGWDQLRRVPPGLQSGVRVIVLFTDGAPNAISANFRRRLSPTDTTTFVPTHGTLHVQDFPARGGFSSDTPVVRGLQQSTSSCCGTIDRDPSCTTPGGCPWLGPLNHAAQQYTDGRLQGIPQLPKMSTHQQPQSPGMPTSFPFYTPGLPGQRQLLVETTGTANDENPYPSHAQNVAKASRNLVETIANEARNDGSGQHRIRIFTLGLGQLLNEPTGYPAETGSSILQRIANDPESPDFDDSQLEGKYYFAGDPTQLENAFQEIRDQIIRLTE